MQQRFDRRPHLTSADILSEARFSGGVVCPRCKGAVVIRWGRFASTKQRYRCQECRRTFNAMTATPFAYSKRLHLWGTAAQCVVEGISVRQMARRLGIDAYTAFRWRHRLLSAIAQAAPEALSGIVEADETYLRSSEKGARNLTRKPRHRGHRAARRGLSTEQVCVLIARDRHKHTVASVVGRGSPSPRDVERALRTVIAPGSILCTDGSSAYGILAAVAGLTHCRVAGKHGRGARGSVYHIQNVNAYHGRLKRWLRRFNGVATKYLPNYLGWHGFLDRTAMLSHEHAHHQLLVETCAV